MNATSEISGQRLFEAVRRYCAWDDHRTGGAGDRAVSDWLAGEMEGIGFEVTRQAFQAPGWRVGRAELRCGDAVFSGFPLWPPQPAEISGPLSEPDRPAADAIAVVRFPLQPGGAYREALQGKVLCPAFAVGAKAVIALTEGPTGLPIALNMPVDQPAWPVPVLILGEQDEAVLRSLAGQVAHLTMAVDPDATVRPENVVATRGHGPTVVVTTPKSGWFRCGGERGPGIALWLALARYAAADRRPLRWLFAANSGHELENAGAAALHALVPAPEETALWLHLGAGIATRRWSDATPAECLPGSDPRRFLVASRSLLAGLREAFAGQPGLSEPHAAEAGFSAGELTAILQRGYAPAVGFFAAHRYHHTMADEADRTAPELLEPVAVALTRFLDGLPLPACG